MRNLPRCSQALSAACCSASINTDGLLAGVSPNQPRRARSLVPPTVCRRLMPRCRCMALLRFSLARNRLVDVVVGAITELLRASFSTLLNPAGLGLPESRFLLFREEDEPSFSRILTLPPESCEHG
ncbi:hypothetical protein B566_EDAN008901, partial [Ephemera danica]